MTCPVPHYVLSVDAYMARKEDGVLRGHKFIRNMVILACAVDAADKALLPATFKALSEQMLLGPKQLGTLVFAQSIAFSVALPAWGALMQFYSARDLMVFGCWLWAFVTLLLACTSAYEIQFLLRLLVTPPMRTPFAT